MVSRILHLLVIDILAVGVAMRRGALPVALDDADAIPMAPPTWPSPVRPV